MVTKQICLFCGYAYDEALGDPAHGIQPGTVWADVSEIWECPDCGSGKDAFVPEDV